MDDSIFVDVEGIKCKVKDSSKRETVRFYQNSLRVEADKYIGEQTMTDKRKGYAEILEINIKIAPFVLGWLFQPENKEEYRVITGRMSIDDFNGNKKKVDKVSKKNKSNKIEKPNKSSVVNDKNKKQKSL